MPQIPLCWSTRKITLLPPSPIPGSDLPPPTSPSPSPFPRWGFALCTDGKEGLYLFGGGKESNGHRNDLYFYSTTENTATLFETEGVIPGPRYRPAMAVHDKDLIVWGGQANSGEGYDGALYALDLTSHVWRKVDVEGQVPTARHGQAYITIGTTFFIHGGDNGKNCFGDMWTFDFSTLHTNPVWRRIPPSEPSTWPPPRWDHTFVEYHGRIIMFGGGGYHYKNDIWLFDHESCKWLELRSSSPVPSPRDGHTTVEIDGVIYLFGGTSGGHLNDLHQFTIATKKWTRLNKIPGSTPAPRCSHNMASVGNRIFILGGYMDSAERTRNVVHVLDILNPNQKQLPPVELEKMRPIIVEKVDEAAIKNISLENLLSNETAQITVDFLTNALENEVFVHTHQQKKALRLLSKITKLHQVFPRCYELSVFDVDCDLTQEVHRGGFGLIYRGMFRGQPVCIKAVQMYKGGANSKALRAHAGELVLSAQILHPNIVPFYGAYISSEITPRICIVSPWMENGNLVEYLNRFPSAPLILLITDILHGLVHLHALDIVHADLKGINILVSASNHAMIADFGVSTIVATSVGTTTAHDFGGSLHWMAPELVNTDDDDVARPTTKSDMWAFGCICHEVSVKEIPFPTFSQVQLVRSFMKGGITPGTAFSSSGKTLPPGPLSILAESCWDYDPDKRPTAAQALQTLTDVKEKDHRRPMTNELAMFSAARDGRSDVKIDYDAGLAVLEQLSGSNHIGSNGEESGDWQMIRSSSIAESSDDTSNSSWNTS